MIQVKFFASVREQMACEGLQIEERLQTVADVKHWLNEHHHPFKKINQDQLCFAVDHQMAQLDTPITAHSEVALFPPVTGG